MWHRPWMCRFGFHSIIQGLLMSPLIQWTTLQTGPLHGVLSPTTLVEPLPMPEMATNTPWFAVMELSMSGENARPTRWGSGGQSPHQDQWDSQRWQSLMPGWSAQHPKTLTGCCTGVLGLTREEKKGDPAVIFEVLVEDLQDLLEGALLSAVFTSKSSINRQAAPVKVLLLHGGC